MPKRDVKEPTLKTKKVATAYTPTDVAAELNTASNVAELKAALAALLKRIK